MEGLEPALFGRLSSRIGAGTLFALQALRQELASVEESMPEGFTTFETGEFTVYLD
ncbi:hypothetical protein [Microvirga massiliensis]|uniref:hypothetical protein n=1 Tax=Microvirga massiliensis TaxID=1033741 RepID=UPI0012B6A889|nr:hypothetical protein [Microvirga massiliensis]